MTDDAWIDTVRIAREIGSVSGLLPSWCKSLREAPYTLFQAIRDRVAFRSMRLRHTIQAPTPGQLKLQFPRRERHWVWVLRTEFFMQWAGTMTGTETPMRLTKRTIQHPIVGSREHHCQRPRPSLTQVTRAMGLFISWGGMVARQLKHTTRQPTPGRHKH